MIFRSTIYPDMFYLLNSSLKATMAEDDLQSQGAQLVDLLKDPLQLLRAGKGENMAKHIEWSTSVAKREWYVDICRPCMSIFWSILDDRNQKEVYMWISHDGMVN